MFWYGGSEYMDVQLWREGSGESNGAKGVRELGHGGGEGESNAVVRKSSASP